jgi:hypothetical protein
MMSWVEDLKNRVKERMTICKNCPYFLPTTQRCSVCGCFMIAKSSIPSSECPKGYW